MFKEGWNNPGIGPMALIVSLQTPHAVMPMLIPEDDDILNVVEYIPNVKE